MPVTRGPIAWDLHRSLRPGVAFVAEFLLFDLADVYHTISTASRAHGTSNRSAKVDYR